MLSSFDWSVESMAAAGSKVADCMARLTGGTKGIDWGWEGRRKAWAEAALEEQGGNAW